MHILGYIWIAVCQIFAVDGEGNLETKGSVRSSLGFGMQDGARGGGTQAWFSGLAEAILSLRHWHVSHPSPR